MILTDSDAAGSAQRSRLHRATLAVVAYFAILGVTNGDWLARIPALAHGLSLSDGMLGLALLAAPAGAVVAAPFAGAFIDRVGSRPLTMAAGLGVAVLPVSFGLARSQAVLMAGMLAFGVAAGVLDVAMNAQAVQVERASGRRLMTSFHACYSFGALAGGLIGGAFAWGGVSPAVGFAMVALPMAVLTVLARPWLIKDGKSDRPLDADHAHVAREAPPAARQRPATLAEVAGPATGASAAGRSALEWLLSPLMVLCVLAICSLLGEGAADGWSAVYLRDNVGTSGGFAALGFAAFALTMAFGRLAGDRLAGRFGPVALLRASGLVAAAGMALVLLTASPVGAIAGFAIYGAGLSCTFPQMIALAGKIRPDRPATAISRVVGIGYLGLLTGPVLIGGLASVAGLAAALILPAALALVIAAGATLGSPSRS